LLFEIFKEKKKIKNNPKTIDLEFDSINTDNYFYNRKSIRKKMKILKNFH